MSRIIARYRQRNSPEYIKTDVLYCSVATFVLNVAGSRGYNHIVSLTDRRGIEIIVGMEVGAWQHNRMIYICGIVRQFIPAL